MLKICEQRFSSWVIHNFGENILKNRHKILNKLWYFQVVEYINEIHETYNKHTLFYK